MTPERVTPESLAELERLAVEATEGPWAAEVAAWGVVTAANGASIASMGAASLLAGSLLERDANARYIAAANPKTVLALIGEVRALRDEIERLRQRLTDALSGAGTGGYRMTTPLRLSEDAAMIEAMLGLVWRLGRLGAGWSDEHRAKLAEQAEALLCACIRMLPEVGEALWSAEQAATEAAIHYEEAATEEGAPPMWGQKAERMKRAAELLRRLLEER